MDKLEQFEVIAREAIIEKIRTEDIADVPEPYVYYWSDDIESDIHYLKTMVNQDETIYSVQFYATDKSNAWIGTVYIEGATDNTLEVISEHIFTSGVTPYMSLGARAYSETEESDYGTLQVVKRGEKLPEITK